MFERLGSAIEEVEVPSDGDAIAEVLGWIDRLQAKVSVAIGEFDAGGSWELDAATSMTAWLRTRAGMTGSTARSTVATASRLRSLPVTSAAWVEGSLSGGQVAVVTANVGPRHVPLFAAHEAAVVPGLVGLSMIETTAAMRSWRAHADALVDGPEPSAAEGSLHLSRTLDGRHELSGTFDVEGGEVVATALRLADDGDLDRLPAARRADALVDVCRFYLDHQDDRLPRRHRPHLNVVVDYEALVEGRGGRVVGGGHLDGAAVRRLLCDCAVNRVVTDGRSTVLDYGITTRVVPPNLWAALVLRDEHCRHDGCDRPAHMCEAHHVVPWQEGGSTGLDNLVLKCRRHHGIGHKAGWQEKLLPDGELVATDPQGRTRSTRPPGLRQMQFSGPGGTCRSRPRREARAPARAC